MSTNVLKHCLSLRLNINGNQPHQDEIIKRLFRIKISYALWTLSQPVDTLLLRRKILDSTLDGGMPTTICRKNKLSQLIVSHWGMDQSNDPSV